MQRCIVHQVRNTLKYVGKKNKKEFATDLKKTYHAPSEDAAQKQLKAVTEKWEKEYPNAMKIWHIKWDVISPIFKFSAQVRKVIYTTNAIESLNSCYRRLNKQRSVFPSDTALLKALYTITIRLDDWENVLEEIGAGEQVVLLWFGNRISANVVEIPDTLDEIVIRLYGDRTLDIPKNRRLKEIDAISNVVFYVNVGSEIKYFSGEIV